MTVKNIATSAARFDAMSSLARTDDVLAVIGIIMLLGVIFSAYGSFWQGLYARASYKKEFTAADTRNNNTKFFVITGVASILIIALLIYVFKSKNGHSQGSEGQDAEVAAV